jgi:outer membrane receptor protein involved in Fe transport
VLPYGLNLSAIVFWRSGAAFNPRGLVDSDGDGLVDQRDLTQLRNAFRIKSYGDVDLRLEKRVPLGHQALSVLIEAFNVFNRDNVANVNAVAGPQFGTPATYLPGREIQLGVRYFFRPQ